MTNQETIANLNMIKVAFVEPVTKEQRKLIDDTFDNAIKALEQEPCQDTIRLHGTDGNIYKLTISNGKEFEQEQKTGHWYIDERPESDRETICSNCEQSIFKYHKMDFDYRPKYCPNCGAKMEGEAE